MPRLRTIWAKTWDRECKKVFTKLAVRKLLNIKSRDTINDHCLYFGYEAPFVEEQVEQLFLMNLWLRAGYGAKHGRSNFLRLKRLGKLDSEFQKLGISVEEELRKLRKRIANGDHINCRTS
ncbi:MAG: hypothetical protein F6K58_08785 [Symploca sp. SIO2E9]|nr:hypothetical protein [Symploca sp. SIO2E9]